MIVITRVSRGGGVYIFAYFFILIVYIGKDFVCMYIIAIMGSANVLKYKFIFSCSYNIKLYKL